MPYEACPIPGNGITIKRMNIVANAQNLSLLPLRSRSFASIEKNLVLHAMISSFGHAVETKPEYRWNGLSRGSKDFAVFQITISGRGRLDYSGKTFTLLPGDAFLVHIPHDHSYYLPEESESWEFAYVVVYGAEIVRLAKSFLKRSDPVFKPTADSPIYQVLYEVLTMRDDASPYTASESAYRLLMNILGESSITSKEACGESSLFIERAKHIIEEEIGSCLDIGSISARVGLSRHYFSRLFKCVEGISPQDYITHQRHKKALNLLYSDVRTVKEIAFLCGYRDANYFCRNFKRITGLSPGAYRKIGI